MWATCETEHCDSRLIPIPITGGLPVVCGVCSSPVTNITDIKPEEGTVLPEWILDQLAMQNSDN